MAVDVGVAAADRDVEDDVEPMVDALGPPGRPDPALADAEVLLAVVVPADLLVRGVPAVDDRSVGLVAGVAGGARPQIAAEAVALVAGAGGAVRILLGQVAAVQGARIARAGVDVLQDVDLPGHRPYPRSQQPEPRPVAGQVGPLGLLERRDDHHLAPGRGAEIAAPGLDPAGRPRGAVAQRNDLQVAVAVEPDVRRRGRIPLDFAGAERALAGVVLPRGVVEALPGRAVETVRPDLHPRFGRGRRHGLIRRGAGLSGRIRRAAQHQSGDGGTDQRHDQTGRTCGPDAHGLGPPRVWP